MKSILIEVDLVQAEWVVTAYLAQDPRMLEIIKEGLDPHLMTGCLISDAPEDFVKAENKLVGHETDPGVVESLRKGLPRSWKGQPTSSFFMPRTMSIRQAGKKSNHALDYDMGYKRFALENEMLENDARKVVEAYHRAYPGIRKRFHRMVQLALKEKQYLENCFGRKGVFIGEIDVKLLDSAYAFLPQSTVADIANKGMSFIYLNDAHLRRVEILLNGHDSLLLQAAYTDADDLLHKMRVISEYMATPARYHGETFVIRREFKLGHTWGSMVEVNGQDIGAVQEALDVAAAST